MLSIFFVALGGAMGSVCRYLLGGWFASRFGAAFPYGTFFINVTGSFIIGFFLAFAQERVWLSPYWRLFFAVGVLGGYTTFSSYEYESIQLLQDGEMLLGAIYMLGSMIVGGGAAIAGVVLGTWV